MEQQLNGIKVPRPSIGKNVMYTGWIVLILSIGISGTTMAKDPTKQEQQREIRSMAKKTLTELYEVQPKARKVVEGAAGYAVFSNFGTKILVVGGGTGKGVVVDRKTGKETFMKMVEAQMGIGLGAKSYRQVWVFKTDKAMNDFVGSGWEFGGQATAAAKKGEEGGALAGAISVNTDIALYQLTDTGLEAMASAKGTKYYKDDELN
jgi:lipid-binding SYLF domain-containing protein